MKNSDPQNLNQSIKNTKNMTDRLTGEASTLHSGTRITRQSYGLGKKEKEDTK